MSLVGTDIAICELKVGYPLNCDILDTSGIVLMRKGLILSQEVVDGWTRRGFARVLLGNAQESKVINDQPDDNSPDAQAARLIRLTTSVGQRADSELYAR